MAIAQSACHKSLHQNGAPGHDCSKCGNYPIRSCAPFVLQLRLPMPHKWCSSRKEKE